MEYDDPIPPQLDAVIEIFRRAQSGTITDDDLWQLELATTDIWNHLRGVALAIALPDRDDLIRKGVTYVYGPELAHRASRCMPLADALRRIETSKCWGDGICAAEEIRSIMSLPAC